jgi:hexulose-6-phosphate isomerase
MEVWNSSSSPLRWRATWTVRLAYVRAYVDGNMLFYGYPQDWIRTLGKRIHRVHLKDFRVHDEKLEWKNLGEGAVDWPEVRKAFAEVGYDGWVTAELDDGDAAYLKDVAARIDRFLAGQKPVA